jgi:hypothetical protein
MSRFHFNVCSFIIKDGFNSDSMAAEYRVDSYNCHLGTLCGDTTMASRELYILLRQLTEYRRGCAVCGYLVGKSVQDV